MKYDIERASNTKWEKKREIILKFIKNKFKHTETHLYIVS